MELSKMAPECRECQFKDKCKNKRMVGYLVAELPLPNTKSISQTMAIKYTPVTINLGNEQKIGISLEEVQKQIEKEFYKHLGVGVIK